MWVQIGLSYVERFLASLWGECSGDQASRDAPLIETRDTDLEGATGGEGNPLAEPLMPRAGGGIQGASGPVWRAQPALDDSET